MAPPSTSSSSTTTTTTTTRDPVTVPDDVQTLLLKQNRMKFFIAQYEEEWQLLDKVKDACSNLVTYKERATHLSVYGPGQPSQIQIKLDLNEWTTAQNNAMMKQDIIEVYLKDYKRQMESYEKEIVKRGFQVPTGESSTTGLTTLAERSPAPSTAGSVAGSTAGTAS